MDSQLLTIITNALVVLCVVVVAAFLKQPLALFGLLLLKELPPSVRCKCDEGDEDESSKPIGFVHDGD